MASHQHNPNNLDFISRCLPGSPAERKEAERLAEFHRLKALQQAEEKQMEIQNKAQREKKYQEDCEANKARMKTKTTVYSLRSR